MGDHRPGLAGVVGAIDEWAKVVELVAVHREVRRACVIARRFHDADHAPLRQIFGSNVGPVLSAIGGDLDQTVIGACPQHVFFHR